MKVKLLLFVLLFSVLNLCLKAQVRLVPADSVLMVDSVNDETVRIRLVIDRTNDTIFKDSILIFYVSQYPDPCVESEIRKVSIHKCSKENPFRLFFGNHTYTLGSNCVWGENPQYTFKERATKKYWRLQLHRGKIKFDRLYIRPFEKKYIEFDIPTEQIVRYEDSYWKTSKRVGVNQDNQLFFISMSYKFSIDSDETHWALNKYDTKSRKQITPYKGILESEGARVVFIDREKECTSE